MISEMRGFQAQEANQGMVSGGFKIRSMSHAPSLQDDHEKLILEDRQGNVYEIPLCIETDAKAGA